ncbi:MAG: hybrid sensor histidine kinase/response regulator [Acidobacteria bacterium]|nr:hybrid sensor histidine kinase/response regulator [Acidobacteriota bacterium]
MTEGPADRGASRISLGGLAGMSLGARLVLFGTLVTLVSVAGSFALLSVEIRRQTRSHLADLLAGNQKTVLALQKRSFDELLWTSRLMTQSPTLRAAMETYESESPSSSGRRPDLLATVQTELDRIRELLGKDLAVITDSRGVVLAASPATGRASGEPLELKPFVRRALETGAFSGQSSFGVLKLQQETYQIGCVPIVLQDFAIGTLTLGTRIDASFLDEMRKTLQSDVVLTLGTQVLGSTLPSPFSATGSSSSASLAGLLSGEASKNLVTLAGEEFVGAALSLGQDRDGHDVTLVLLRPLGRDLSAASRSILVALSLCALLALLLAGVLAWRVSRSVLDPLERFVAFVRTVAETGDHSLRFQGSESSAEVKTLNQAYHLLMDSLQEHEKRMLLHAREEMGRVERLKESEKLASLGRMLSGAAHEINNPLTGIVGNLDILLRTPHLDAPIRERLERMQKESQRIIGLVRNLLKVAHRDTGQRTAVDLHQILRETVALRRHDFAAAGFELRLETPTSPLALQGNELELQQVFLNLINNAYDALKEFARDPCLSIRATQEDSQVVVTFEDGGPGMKDPRKVFDHFYTTKEVGKGTGLGLSITHAIMQGHGGRIAAENRSEGGARFTLVLPLTSAEPPRRVPAISSVQPRDGAAPIPATILVVEDEYTILELQMAILSSVGATAVGVSTGQEAVQQIQRREYQLIISDLRLPGGFSGQELFRWIEKNRPSLTRRVIFVTGDSASEATRAFLEQSGRRYLMKPFSVEDYVQAVRETLDGLRSAA